jgi:filamentous hemagglutinin family protein
MTRLSLPPRFRRCALAAAVSWAAATAWANPVGPTVVNGGASFSQQGSTLTVTNTPGAIINWQQFSVGIGETTRFVQQNAASAVLNRVVGQDPSSILGTLQSNGRVYLVNPNGIVFGAGAVVDVAGLVASTLGLSDQDFLAGRNVFSGGGAGALSNQGSIATAQGGQVYLVAPNIDNSGIIRAPGGEVILAAGHSVDLVDPANPQISVALDAPDTQAVNVGQVLAQGGRIGIYGALVNQRGTVSADTAVAGENGKIVLRASKTLLVEGGSVTSAANSAGQGGEIQLLGDQVGLTGNASVDASGAAGGGTVLVGGDSRGTNPLVRNASATFVGADATVRADALAAGNGGKVVVWGTDAARVYGALSARGGALSGNGGFIETSGGYLDATRTPDVSAPNGLGGSWLLDPYDIIIGATDTPATYTGSPNFVGAGGGSTSYIGASVINTALDAGNVIVDTTGAGTGTGNITLDSGSTIGRTAAGTSTLTLQAHNDIILNGNITATAPGVTNVVLVADQDSNGAGAVAINAPINTNGGNVTISSSGNITFNASQGLGYDNIVAGAGSVTLSSSLGSIVGDTWGSPYDVVASSVNVTAKTGIGDMYGSMFYLNTPTVTFNNTGTGGVGIYVNTTTASNITGSNAGGGVRLDSFYSAAATNIGPITAAGDVLLRINNPNIIGTVNAGTNTVYLSSYNNSPVLPISIGGAQTTDFTQTELNFINAGNIVVGYDNFGNTTPTLTVDSSVNLGSRNITLKGGSISLNGGTLTATGGITLNSSSGITLNGLLDAGAGNVSMTAVSSIADGNGVSVNNVNANTLTAMGTTIDLDTSVNNLMANATTGNLTIREADGASGVSLMAAGNIALSSAAGNLDLLNVSAGGTVNLSAPSGTLNGGVISTFSLTASALGMNLSTSASNLSLTATGAGGGININQAGLVMVNNASTADGPINITSSGAMNAVNVGAGGAWGISLLASSGDITVGSLSAPGDYVRVNASAGAILDGNGATNNIQATGLELKAATGIGSAATPLGTQVTDLWSTGGSGGTYIANTSALLNAWNMTGAGVALTHGGGDLGVGLIDVGGSDAFLTASSGAIKDLNGAGVNNFVARNLTLAATNGADFDYMISGVLDTSGVTGVVNARVYSNATTTSPTVTQTVNTTTASTNTLATPVSQQQQAAATAQPVEKKEDAAAEDKAANGENGKNGDQGEKKKDAKKPRSCN